MARSRGGQPGNANALKHGFYSTYLQPTEHTDLDLVEFGDITSEIAMLRAYTRRLLEADKNNPESSPAFAFSHAIDLLDALGRSAAIISGLVYRLRMLNGDGDTDIVKSLFDAINIVNSEIKRK